MSTESIKYKGYTINIDQDQDAENPFEAWGCEMPLITFSGYRHGDFKSYQGAPDGLREVFNLLPPDFFDKKHRMDLYREYLSDKYTLREVAEAVRGYISFEDTFKNLLIDLYGEKPSSWSEANEWFDLVETLLKRATIPCLNTQSNGYSQGDSILVLAVTTPEWCKLAGVTPENAENQLQSAVDLYSAWAWGSVYGVESVAAPGVLDEYGYEMEGEEIADASVWGFYGSNHGASGLMDHARAVIDAHIEATAKEAENIEAALCSMD